MALDLGEKSLYGLSKALEQADLRPCAFGLSGLCRIGKAGTFIRMPKRTVGGLQGLEAYRGGKSEPLGVFSRCGSFKMCQINE